MIKMIVLRKTAAKTTNKEKRKKYLNIEQQHLNIEQQQLEHKQVMSKEKTAVTAISGGKTPRDPFSSCPKSAKIKSIKMHNTNNDQQQSSSSSFFEG